MARSARRRYWISIILMLVIVGGIWGGVLAADLKPQLGLDLQGGVSVVLAPRGEVKPDALEKAVDIIRQRIDALGVAEPDVSRQGENVLIEIPGIRDGEKALQTIGRTAELRMRPVLREIVPGSQEYETIGPARCDEPFGARASVKPTSKPTPKPASPKPTASPKATASGEIHAQALPSASPKAASPKSSPKPASPSPTPKLANPADELDDPGKTVILCARQRDASGDNLPAETWTKLELGPAALIGSDVKTAVARLRPDSPQWEVNLTLSGEGAPKFEKITGQLACNPQGDAKRQLAIVLDGIVESHPQMGDEVKCNEGLSGGTAVISGSFTESQSKDLELVLKFGALPVALDRQEVNEVSPTLGKDSLRSGLLAGIIGVTITMLYVLVFYRILGLVIWVGLAMHALFTLGVVIIMGKTVGFSLTLAGIAGLIVSVGIAADSFIVYFERLKDELHQGKTVRSSVDRAWSSAWRTIVAADLVTALAAAALYLLAVGGVRGFALMLGLAVSLDLLISYLLMHPLVWLLAQTKFFNNSKRLGIKSMAGVAPAPVSGGQR